MSNWPPAGAHCSSDAAWTEDDFLRDFEISKEQLLSWIAQGLGVLRCDDESLRIPREAIGRFVEKHRIESPYLTAEEAAQYLRLPSVKALYGLLERGKLEKLPGTRICLFTRQMLDKCVQGEEV